MSASETNPGTIGAYHGRSAYQQTTRPIRELALGRIMNHYDTKIADLEARLADLTERLERSEAPRAQSPASASAVDATASEQATSTRRGVLKLAGAAAAGVAAVAVTGTTNHVAALSGDTMTLGQAGDGTVATDAAHQSSGQTRFDWLPGGTGVGFLFQAGSTYKNHDASVPCALAGWTTSATNPTGVYGYSNIPAGNGVVGVSGGVGVAGSGGTYALSAISGGKASLLLGSATTAPPTRIDAHAVGEMENSNGDLWWCVAAGMPGTWRKISGTGVAGAFHPVTPGRVYDSRQVLPTPGQLASGANRTISVADRRDATLTTGAVVQANFVPAGATAIAANITVTATVGSGFLVCNPGGVTTVGASTINWSATAQTIANGVILALDTTRQLTIVAGGGGTTQFIVDITGYYL